MPRVRVSESRAVEVGRLLSRLGVRAVLELEDADPQRVAALVIRSHVGAWAPVYTLLLALASYRLSARGEEWWSSYADFVVSRRKPESLEDVVGDVVDFIYTSPGAGVRRDEKARRVERASRSARGLLLALREDNSIVYTRAQWILGEVSRSLGAPWYSKTVVFALKMAYYAVRSPGEARVVEGVDAVPVDSRVACASYSSLIVEAESYRDALREQREVSRAWALASRASGIPGVHLDSLLWLTGWAPRDLDLSAARVAVAETLSRVASRDLAEQIAVEICRRECR
ncbi:MAG: N-glycosylase/DNA lyase [Acidilobaceae archaeon]